MTHRARKFFALLLAAATACSPLAVLAESCNHTARGLGQGAGDAGHAIHAAMPMTAEDVDQTTIDHGSPSKPGDCAGHTQHGCAQNHCSLCFSLISPLVSSLAPHCHAIWNVADQSGLADADASVPYRPPIRLG